MDKATHTTTTILIKQSHTLHKKNYTLNSKQIRLLNLLFKFRFITVPLLANYLHVTDWSTLKSLQILTERGLVARRYSSTDKLHGIAARYYLAKDQLSKLPLILGVTTETLHPFYKNNTVTRAYVDHHITVLDSYIHFISCYPNTFRIFSRYELSNTDIFPDMKPDMYMDNQRRDTEYFFELGDNIQSFVARKRFKTLLDYFCEGRWVNERNPVLLFVLRNGTSERTFQRYAARKLEYYSMADELTVFTTTIDAITKNYSNPAIWTDVTKQGRVCSLQ